MPKYSLFSVGWTLFYFVVRGFNENVGLKRMLNALCVKTRSRRKWSKRTMTGSFIENNISTSKNPSKVIHSYRQHWHLCLNFPTKSPRLKILHDRSHISPPIFNRLLSMARSWSTLSLNKKYSKTTLSIIKKKRVSSSFSVDTVCFIFIYFEFSWINDFSHYSHNAPGHTVSATFSRCFTDECEEYSIMTIRQSSRSQRRFTPSTVRLINIERWSSSTGAAE